MSARAGPTIAEPVSCAIIRRLKLVVRRSFGTGTPAWMKNGVPYTCSALSTAIDRSAVSGIPWAPSASRASEPSDRPTIRKNTKDRFCRRTSSAPSGLARIQSRMRCIDISSRGMMLRSMRTRPTGTYG
jgi:hypothetical protein